MGQLRAIIIDEDRARRENVRSLLPDYIDSVTIGFGDSSFEYLKPDAEGVTPDLVIMNGDDSRNLGLYTFDWMINKSGNPDVAAIPVIVLTEDEFSDRSLEFLEIGDVLFYEGEIEGEKLFSVINEALEEAEFMAEPVYPSFEEQKSIDRIAGLSVKAPEGEKQRVLVLDMQTRLDNLEAALARGRKRANDIRNLLEAAQKAKGDKNAGNRGYAPKQDKAYINRMSSFLAKANQKAAAEEERLNDLKKQMQQSSKQVIKRDNIGESNKESIGKLQQKMMSNPFGAFNAQGSLKLDEPTRRTASTPSSNGKRTVVIVDGDLKTRKLCSLFLTQNYNVVQLDSGIKTVDYFVKNRADLLIINPVLGGMSGVSTVISVHNQPGCMNVPVMYLVGDDYKGSRTGLLGQNVVGILNKPIKRELIASAVEGLFGRM